MSRLAAHRLPDPETGRLIDASEWSQMRWGWLESVRRDNWLNPMARLVAHVLALDYAHHATLRCDPSMREIAGVVGASEDTVKRAILALLDRGWIVRHAGVGRGRSSGYGFITRARVVHLKGGKSAPLKGGKSAPLSGEKPGSEKGAYLPEKGGKSASAYNKAKPYKNHGAREGARKRSENPMVVADAERAVASFREGRTDALETIQPWVLDHIVAAQLLTTEELKRAGIFAEN